MEQKKVKRCKVCAQDNHRSSFAQLLRSNNHLLKTGVKFLC